MVDFGNTLDAPPNSNPTQLTICIAPAIPANAPAHLNTRAASYNGVKQQLLTRFGEQQFDARKGEIQLMLRRFATAGVPYQRADKRPHARSRSRTASFIKCVGAGGIATALRSLCGRGAMGEQWRSRLAGERESERQREREREKEKEAHPGMAVACHARLVLGRYLDEL